jgi:hypothetical protein
MSIARPFAAARVAVVSTFLNLLFYRWFVIPILLTALNLTVWFDVVPDAFRNTANQPLLQGLLMVLVIGMLVSLLDVWTKSFTNRAKRAVTFDPPVSEKGEPL